MLEQKKDRIVNNNEHLNIILIYCRHSGDENS